MLSFVKNQNRDNMIFDIYGKQIDGKLIFELPYYRFEYREEIAITHLVVEWKSAREKVFAYLDTSLVDLGPENPKQQLVAFTKPGGTSITDIRMNPVFYDVQIQQMDEATFKIKSMFGKPLPEIKNVYCQLITVSDT